MNWVNFLIGVYTLTLTVYQTLTLTVYQISTPKYYPEAYFILPSCWSIQPIVHKIWS
jgi:hypothetical protein